MSDLPVSEARDKMVVDHSCRLHVRVADCGAHELEPARLKIPAHRVGFPARCGYLLYCRPFVPYGPAAREAPDVLVEAAELPFYPEERLRVAYRRDNLQPVAYYAGIAEQGLDLSRVVLRHLLGIEAVERLPEVLPLAQDGLPAEACLHALQDKELEYAFVVMQRHTPLRIVVPQHKGVVLETPVTPGSAVHAFA